MKKNYGTLRDTVIFVHRNRILRSILGDCPIKNCLQNTRSELKPVWNFFSVANLSWTHCQSFRSIRMNSLGVTFTAVWLSFRSLQKPLNGCFCILQLFTHSNCRSCCQYKLIKKILLKILHESQETLVP